MANKNDHGIIKPWYAEIRKQLTSHFKSVEAIERSATNRSENHGHFMKQVHDIINDHLSDETFNVATLAIELCLSRSQAFRKIKLLTNMSPVQYIRYYRLHHAKTMLESGRHTVSQVAEVTGFVSLSHFTRVFKELFGFNPSSLKK